MILTFLLESILVGTSQSPEGQHIYTVCLSQSPSSSLAAFGLLHLWDCVLPGAYVLHDNGRGIRRQKMAKGYLTISNEINFLVWGILSPETFRRLIDLLIDVLVLAGVIPLCSSINWGWWYCRWRTVVGITCGNALNPYTSLLL